MATFNARRCGDFKTSYSADQTIYATNLSCAFVLVGIALLCAAPLVLDRYLLNLLIQIGYLGIAALGLNIALGFTGQISIGHAAFFGFGAFCSAWITKLGMPALLAIPIAAIATSLVGLAFGIPAARIKGLYLAIATLAAQFILTDFFSRAEWFTGGVHGAIAAPVEIASIQFDTDERYFYVVLIAVILSYLAAANLMRTRDGRALIAVRDHYLSAEMMGINLTKYRTMSFAIAAFYAGLGGALYAHYLGYVSVEAFTIVMSIQFIAMVIIGGLGSVMGSLLGAAFMVLLPEIMSAAALSLSGSRIDAALGLREGVAYLREMAIGAVIILFLIFEPDGLAHRWRQIKAYWKLYPFAH